MKVTGKCKTDFEKWYIKNIFKICVKVYIDDFYTLPQSMQYGVYVDFFDSVGIKSDAYAYFEFYKTHTLKDLFNTREEARTKGIKKANEIRNK